MTFTLWRIIWDDGKPSLDPDDYEVIEDGKKVGRIYRTLVSGGKQRWRWSVYNRNLGGLVDSLDEAKGAFKAAFRELRNAAAIESP